MKNLLRDYHIIVAIMLITLSVAIGFVIKRYSHVTVRVMKVEYKLELIDQNTVHIKSMLTGNNYYTSPDSIVYYLDIDNL